jgi:tetratricopeptide (TPR) repeat protein
MLKQEAKSPQAGRPHRVPPPPAPLDRTGVLGQVESAAGLVLWRALGDARLWGESRAEDRRKLFRTPSPEVRDRFAYACTEVPALAPAFGTFALLLRSPALVTTSALADACRLVHEWADRSGLVLTALLFAEAAAYADPASPTLANLAARSARRALMYDRAGGWHLRAYKLAVRAKDAAENVWALIGYGAMMKKTDRIGEARRYLLRAARGARAAGRRKEAGMAHHDLMNIAVELERYTLAEYHASGALALYPQDHPRIPALGHDFAFALLRQRHYGAALRLLERVVPLIPRAEERALVLSTLAWAAAGAGRLSRFAQAEQHALQLVGIHEDHAPSVFLHLAEGLRAAGEATRAAQYAEAAAEAGARRLDAPLEREARAMCAVLGTGTARPSGEAPAAPRTDSIARDLTARLKRWRAPEAKPA